MKVLAWKLKKKMAQQTFHKIKDPLTKVQTKLKELQTFYTTLYTKKNKKKTGCTIAERWFSKFSGITSAK